nr:hypothetical protein [Tanacetum cinerariifolium]
MWVLQPPSTPLHHNPPPTPPSSSPSPLLPSSPQSCPPSRLPPHLHLHLFDITTTDVTSRCHPSPPLRSDHSHHLRTLHAYFAAEGIKHQTSVARTPEQNGVVERRNRTLIEVAQTMLSAAKVPLFFWAEAIATACFTQNLKFFHIFGSIRYIVRDGENLDKIKEKGDECIFVRYSTQSRAYRVFNKRTRVIMESIHVNFDEMPQMASAHNSSDPDPTCQTMASIQISSDPAPECQTMALEHGSLSPGRKCQENVSHGDKTVQNSSDPGPTRQSMASVQNSSDPAPTCQRKASVQISSDPAPECQTMALKHGSLSPGRNCQENVSHGDKTVTTSNELDLLFSPMFDELLNGSSKVVSKSSAVSAADAPNQRQPPTTPLINHSTPVPT